MANVGSKKRSRDSRDGYVRRHDRNKFRKTTNPTTKRKDLGNGMKGILFSCTPGHENHAFREAVIMLGKYCDNESKQLTVTVGEKVADRRDSVENGGSVVESRHEGGNASEASGGKPTDVEGKQGVTEEKPELEDKSKAEPKTQQKAAVNPSGNSDMQNTPVDISKELEEELKEVRDPKKKLFTREDIGVKGSIFLQVTRPDIDREKLVESALREARSSGSPNSRHCIRLLPVHTTCYARPEEAARAAVEVVKEHFPAVDGSEKPASYAIAFRHRLNTGAHRDDFITAIAKGIHDHEPRYTVELTKPDVTLLVEVLKTSCCIGTFRHYYELAKMNLREAACPSVPKRSEKPEAKTVIEPQEDKAEKPEAKALAEPQNKEAEKPKSKPSDIAQQNEIDKPGAEQSGISEKDEAEVSEAKVSNLSPEGAKKEIVSEAGS